MGLGKRLRQVRGNKSQSEFGKIIGISQSSVGVYESESRLPDSKVLTSICNAFEISPAWLLMGIEPMHAGGDKEKIEGKALSQNIPKEGTGAMADMSAIPPSSLPTQPIENVSSPIQKMADMSAIAPLYEENRSLYQKNMELQERLLKVSEDKAELQVALERAAMNIERRDMRIRELEEENARLREARKGPSPVFRAATGEAN